MNLEVDPAPGGVVSLSTALSDELERLRFVLKALKGAISGSAPAHWYTAMSGFSSFLTLSPTAARVEQTAPQSIAPGSQVAIIFDTPIYNTTGTMVVSNGQLKAPVDGVYIIGATVAFGSALNDLQLMLVQGAANLAVDEVFATAAMPKKITVETIKHLTTGTTITAQVLHTSALPISTVVSASIRPAFWMAMISK